MPIESSLPVKWSTFAGDVRGAVQRQGLTTIE